MLASYLSDSLLLPLTNDDWQSGVPFLPVSAHGCVPQLTSSPSGTYHFCLKIPITLTCSLFLSPVYVSSFYQPCRSVYVPSILPCYKKHISNQISLTVFPGVTLSHPKSMKFSKLPIELICIIIVDPILLQNVIHT
ncbi:hypothetical protein AAHE18_10G063700 [Arachis hypogaea]